MKKQATASLSPEIIRVKVVKTDVLIPNPHNPRMLFDKAPMLALENSIRKVGILVPLTVYWDPRRKRYVILDGQRRWMTAQKQKIKTVPVNQVAEPSVVQNIVTMFQIHKVREDWELMPTALKLEVLMNELKEKNDASLAVLTGLDQAVVIRCKKLLSYNREFQDLMLAPDPIQRIKADFFIELYVVRTDRLVNSMKWFDKDEFTWQMLQKYLTTKTLRSVTDFRIIKQHISNARRAGKTKEITKRLREFAQNPELPVDHLLINEADVSASARKALGTITTLYKTIEALDPEKYYGEESLWNKLSALRDLITKKLEMIGRRLKA
ncbi:MAG: ParB/RepB/Spo0J family partition protein [Pyrinomonadaceae bacterium]